LLRRKLKENVMASEKRRFETLALHGGAYRADPVVRA
jgi:hypothetical protein